MKGLMQVCCHIWKLLIPCKSAEGKWPTRLRGPVSACTPFPERMSKRCLIARNPPSDGHEETMVRRITPYC